MFLLICGFMTVSLSSRLPGRRISVSPSCDRCRACLRPSSAFCDCRFNLARFRALLWLRGRTILACRAGLICCRNCLSSPTDPGLVTACLAEDWEEWELCRFMRAGRTAPDAALALALAPPATPPEALRGDVGTAEGGCGERLAEGIVERTVILLQSSLGARR